MSARSGSGDTLHIVRGAVTGFGVVLIASLAWAVFVLARAWADGDLARTYPDCDPCGFVGYAGRMVFVTGMFLVMFGVPAAAVGWLVERILSHRPPTNSSVTTKPTARRP